MTRSSPSANAGYEDSRSNAPGIEGAQFAPTDFNMPFPGNFDDIHFMDGNAADLLWLWPQDINTDFLNATGNEFM